jgi:hypothetical protein
MEVKAVVFCRKPNKKVKGSRLPTYMEVKAVIFLQQAGTRRSKVNFAAGLRAESAQCNRAQQMLHDQLVMRRSTCHDQFVMRRWSALGADAEARVGAQ